MSGPSTSRTFRADRGDARVRRLDLAVLRRLEDRPEISRAQVQAWIDSGLVRVNSVPAAKASSRVAAGDEIEVVLPPPPPPPPLPLAQEMPVSILYEDEHLLAVDKPAGLVVHPTHGYFKGTLLNALLWRSREWGGEERRPGLVNRLDRDTSGVLLVAKGPEMHAALVRAFAAVAGRKGCTPAQLALAWLLAKGDDIVPIPGTTRRKHLEKTVASLEAELSTSEIASLEEVMPPHIAAGTRYSEASMQRLSL